MLGKSTSCNKESFIISVYTGGRRATTAPLIHSHHQCRVPTSSATEPKPNNPFQQIHHPPTKAMLPRLPLQRAIARNLCARSIPPAAVCRRHASNFGSAPGPPKLPAQEQAEFERLQRQAAVSSAFQPEAAAAETSSAAADATTQATSTSSSAVDSELREGGGLYRGAKPEFDGDKNPRTGEVGGPKNEPLRWGSGGDWSYNGKVTDF